ncbi:MAG: hypothetical protein HOE48_25125 [Candidatus Latescibacteria bacterium]|jgi:uroporphyrinogen decarboxylase|nr:hypothetical protein [Candidatus Latescibacterota bacterium]MBT5832221.1 hypothetical protein [Candidatus Latescibacterota bacterium]
MTSKERVLTAFAREVPDRVPMNYFANPGIDKRLKQHYGLAENDRDGLRERLGVDFREISAPYVGPKLHAEVPDRTVDMWGIHRRWIAHSSGGYWDYCDFPLQHADVETVSHWPMPDPDDFDYDAAAAQCDLFAPYCVVLGNPGLGDVINSTGMIRTMEQTLVDLMIDEPATLLYIKRKTAVQLEVARRTLETAKGKIDVLWMGEDLGTQRGPLISPALYQKHLRPIHQQFVDLAKAFDLPVMVHSCGSSSWAFDHFIDMGVSVVDTLQPEAKDMSPAYLKSRYGDRLAFHGCLSTAGVVAYGSYEETVQNVCDTLEIMMPGGGYAFAPTHQLQDNSPTENVVAMYETAHRCGVYG